MSLWNSKSPRQPLQLDGAPESFSPMAVAMLRMAKPIGRSSYAKDAEQAVDYLNGDQETDVRNQLALRFPRSQRGGRSGSEILPVFIPLTQRFADEQATAYNRAVTRTLTLPDGTETEETQRATAIYQEKLADASYDELMQQFDRIIIILRAAGLWYQSKRGELRPQIALPHHIYPIAASGTGMNRSDQNDYSSFTVESAWGDWADASSNKRTYVNLSAEQHVYFEGSSASEPEKILGVYPNPFVWPQKTQTVIERWTDVISPGQMLTIWHRQYPTDCLIPDGPSPIARGNRELNIALSILFDTVRYQSYGVPVYQLTNPGDPKVKRPHGLRFPVVLGPGEAADMLQAAANYTEQIEVLRFYIASLAMSERLSPNDITLDGRGASITSGFAKIVDSLPKLDAREERLRRLTTMEQRYATPRNLAILVYNGDLPEAALWYRVKVAFEGIRYPETEDDRAQRYDTDIKYGLTTKAKILAERSRMSEADAETTIEENLATNGPQDSGQLPTLPGASSILGNLIGRPRRPQPGQMQ